MKKWKKRVSPNKGKTLSQETKRRISESRIIGFKNGSIAHSMKGIDVYSLWIKKYGKEEADKRYIERALKKSNKASGKNNPMYGRTFTLHHRTKIRNALIGRKASIESIKKRIEITQKKVIQLELSNDNIIKIWDGINLTSRLLNIPSSNIIECCKGRRQTAGGYRWKYL